jgi:tetratricopeptide (TPR) repeat protein
VNGYAETLRQMGQIEDAYAEYQMILELCPYDRVARNATACLLIDLRRYEEARNCLRIQKLLSEHDWRDSHVIAMSYLKEGQYEETLSRLRYGQQNVPFYDTRAVFETSLAVTELRRKRYQNAVELLDHSTAGNVIEFPGRATLRAHARAELGHIDRANEELNAADEQIGAPIVCLRDVVRRRYRLGNFVTTVLTDSEVTQLDEEIAEQEFDLALRPAA